MAAAPAIAALTASRKVRDAGTASRGSALSAHSSLWGSKRVSRASRSSIRQRARCSGAPGVASSRTDVPMAGKASSVRVMTTAWSAGRVPVPVPARGPAPVLPGQAPGSWSWAPTFERRLVTRRSSGGWWMTTRLMTLRISTRRGLGFLHLRDRLRRAERGVLTGADLEREQRERGEERPERGAEDPAGARLRGSAGGSRGLGLLAPRGVVGLLTVAMRRWTTPGLVSHRRRRLGRARGPGRDRCRRPSRRRPTP